MKYYKQKNFSKAIGSTGFIAMIACVLIAVGAISWFALSRKNNTTTTPSTNNSSSQEYNNNDVTYNNSTAENPNIEQEEIVTDVNENVSNIPYSEEDTSEVTIEEKADFILPVTGNISKGYSDTALQYSATYGDMRMHSGIDILCDNGSDIKSASSGTVKSVVDDATLGKVITIEHTDEITVKYCGMGSINVKEGDKVVTGDVIGTSGEIPSECADNPHIHIEVICGGKTTSPLAALSLE